MLSFWLLLAAAPPDPFLWRADPLVVAPGGGGSITLHLQVPPGHAVYRDRVSVAVPVSWSPGPAALSPGERRPDPFDPTTTREVWSTDGTVAVPVTAPPDLRPGAATLDLSVTHQGCTTGLCWPEATRSIVVPVVVLGP